MVNEQGTGKNVEGSGRGPILGTIRADYSGTEKKSINAFLPNCIASEC
jgi:hypothetical protein